MNYEFDIVLYLLLLFNDILFNQILNRFSVGMVIKVKCLNSKIIYLSGSFNVKLYQYNSFQLTNWFIEIIKLGEMVLSYTELHVGPRLQ